MVSTDYAELDTAIGTRNRHTAAHLQTMLRDFRKLRCRNFEFRNEQNSAHNLIQHIVLPADDMMEQRGLSLRGKRA